MTETRTGCLLKREGGVSPTDVPIDIDLDNFSFLKPFKSIGIGSPQKLGDWLCFDDVILIYGWQDGRAGQENKHEIAPPFDTNLYFGDILCLRLDDNGHLADLSPTEFNSFQEMTMGGFSEIESETEPLDEGEIDEHQNTPEDPDYQPNEKSSDESSDGDDLVCSDSEGELVEEPDSDIVDWSAESGESMEDDNTTSASCSLSDSDT